jgi:hypothetical protein
LHVEDGQVDVAAEAALDRIGAVVDFRDDLQVGLLI